MAKLNNSGNNRCWQGCGKKGTLLHWEATLENSMEVPQIKNRTTLQTRNCSTMYLSKGYKNDDLKGHMHLNVLWQQYQQLLNYGKSPNVHRLMYG